MRHSAFKLALLASLLSRNNEQPRELVSRAKQILEAAEDLKAEEELGELITFADLANRSLIPNSTVSQTLSPSNRKRPEYIQSVRGIKKAVSAFFEAVLICAREQCVGRKRSQLNDWLREVESKLCEFEKGQYLPRVAVRHFKQFQVDRRAKLNGNLVGVAEEITGIQPQAKRPITFP